MFGVNGTNGKATPPFWAWFQAYSTTLTPALMKTAQGASAVAREIGPVFRHSFPDLGWELDVLDDGTGEFYISAGGKVALFPRVQAVVAAAPPVPGWKIVPFAQRDEVEMIELGQATVAFDDVYWSVRRPGPPACVTLWVRGLGSPKNQYCAAALHLVDAAVGEYDAALRLKVEDVRFLPRDHQKRKALRPLAALPAFLDTLPAA
jgi:hypothetical protein